MKQKNSDSDLVTKVDLEKALKPFATKDDISRPEQSTKTDIKELKTEVKGQRAEFKRIEKSLRSELLRLEERIENSDENAIKYRDQILTRLDEVMGELENMREDRTIGTYQTAELRKDVDDHEKRITRLEKTPQII
ncbi:MAG: hypothetical protein M1268_03765 [Patescibacteria group bacterium]|nr:hypothetical protein [Actinomycetota bacterium]MCL5439079.1 hypothetical protein [Patescibacteria group bacterium]